jgi:hypothetical protein
MRHSLADVPVLSMTPNATIHLMRQTTPRKNGLARGFSEGTTFHASGFNRV